VASLQNIVKGDLDDIVRVDLALFCYILISSHVETLELFRLDNYEKEVMRFMIKLLFT